MSSFRTCVSWNIINVMRKSLPTGFENPEPNRGKTFYDFSEGYILSRIHNSLSKFFVPPYERDYCSRSSLLPEVPFYLSFAGKEHEFLSEWSSLQLDWNSKSHPTSAQIAQPELAHLLLQAKTHCSHFSHPCCSLTEPTTIIAKLFLHFIS